MDAPLNATNDMRTEDWTEVVEWLISQAIFRSYQDDKEKHNAQTRTWLLYNSYKYKREIGHPKYGLDYRVTRHNLFYIDNKIKGLER